LNEFRRVKFNYHQFVSQVLGSYLKMKSDDNTRYFPFLISFYTFTTFVHEIAST